MLLFTILLWYITEDIVENIDESLDTFLLVERLLPLTSVWLLGFGPRREFIPMLLEGNIVGKGQACRLVIIGKLKFKEKKGLFAEFPISATM